jgi:aminomethyltransferase
VDLVSDLRRSPLHDRHVSAGAKFAAFGGWEMPVEFAGGGVLSEHAAVRETVGLFDVSHLGTALVRGPGAAAHVDTVLSNDLARIGPGRSQYTLCCAGDGGIVDDLLAYLIADDDLLLVPNAANAAAVLDRLRTGAPAGVEVLDRHAEVAVLAVQGPRADEVLAAVGLPAGHPYGSFVVAEGITAGAITVCRTGYTGERGYELLLDAASAVQLWDSLGGAVTAAGGRPAGLGARDTLRTEMGFPLHGQDIGPTTNPVEARLGWAVGWTKPAFTGRDALTAIRAAGPARRLWGLRAVGRGIPRPAMTVVDASGALVGTVTSGTFSPTLRRGIALALVDTAVAVGDLVTVGIRGRDEQFEVVKPPFVPNHTLG